MKRSHLNLALIICISAIIVLSSAMFITAYLTYCESFFTRGMDRVTTKAFTERQDSDDKEIVPGHLMINKFQHFTPHKFFGGFIFILIIVIIIIAVIKRKSRRHPDNPSAMDRLREQFAVGEITIDEFEKRKKALKEE